MAYCYKHIRLDTNETFYIGIGKSKDKEGRCKRAYSRCKSTHNKWWSSIINKTEYVVEIIVDNIEWEEALKEEKYWIQYYGRRDLGKGPLVNLTDGGEGTSGKVKEKNPKIGLALKGKKRSDEQKKRMSEAFKGRIMSDEAKKNIGNARKGMVHSEETRKKISESNRGKHNDRKNSGYKMKEESKQKISDALKGRKSNYEIKLSIESLEKIQSTRRKNHPDIDTNCRCCNKLFVGHTKYCSSNCAKRYSYLKKKGRL